MCVDALQFIYLWLVCLIDNGAVGRKGDKDAAGL